jgi:hypothetical protein
MTQHDPEPIRKSMLPCTPPSEWEFHTWFPLPDGGGDLVPGQLARGVHIRRRVTYGDWEPVSPDHWADEPPTEADAVLAVLPTTDRAAWASAADHLAGIWQESVRTLAEDARRPGLLAAIEELRRMADEAQPATEARPPRHTWRVETRDPLADEWAPGSHFLSRQHAVERYETANSRAPRWKDGTPVERRIVRETTTYTVEHP